MEQNNNLHLDGLKILAGEIHWMIEKVQELEKALEFEKQNKHVIHYPSDPDNILRHENSCLRSELNEVVKKYDENGKELDRLYLKNERLGIEKEKLKEQFYEINSLYTLLKDRTIKLEKENENLNKFLIRIERKVQERCPDLLKYLLCETE